MWPGCETGWLHFILPPPAEVTVPSLPLGSLPGSHQSPPTPTTTQELANPLRSQIMIETVLATHSCPTLCDSHGLQPTRLLCSWDSPGKNAGDGCHSLLQGIFLTQGLNPGLLHCRRDSLPSDPPGKPDSNTYIALIYPRVNPFPFLPMPSNSHVVMNI